MEEFEHLDFTAEFMEKENLVPYSTPMRNFFRHKSVFLSGGTGFLGQLYVQKLLRSDVRCIYLLVRPKKGILPDDRLKEIFAGKLFGKLYNQDKDFLKRIQIIEGDLTQLKLGISDTDMTEIMENCQIVIHAAADVRFDEALHKLVMINLRGTRELFKIAEKMKKLEAFAYISTAYSHCVRPIINEKFYSPPVDPEVMIKFAENSTKSMDEHLTIMQDLIIRPWPNTYTYTKSLSEEIVRQFGRKLPVCVIRPTIVISTHEDPVPGWCNNIYGLNGCLVACGMGVLRLLPFNARKKGDIVCADFVINSTLAAIWATYEDRKPKEVIQKDPEIYHVCIGQDKQLTWGEISEGTNKTFSENPSWRMLWKHSPNHTTCPFLWKIFTIYYHVLPGLFFDTIFKLRGDKMRLLPVYRKVQKFMAALQHFMVTEYIFKNANMKSVWNRMSKEDQEYFPSDVRRMDWYNFCYDYVTGLKHYIGAEKLDDLVKARVQFRRLTIMHSFVLFFYYGIHIFIFYTILNYYNVIGNWANRITDVYEFLKNPRG